MICMAAASSPRPDNDLHWSCLDHLADLGEPDSQTRQAWSNLLLAHGFPAVLRAVARCYSLVAPFDKVSNEQAQDVLDGRSPRPAPRYRKSVESHN